MSRARMRMRRVRKRVRRSRMRMRGWVDWEWGRVWDKELTGSGLSVGFISKERLLAGYGGWGGIARLVRARPADGEGSRSAFGRNVSRHSSRRARTEVGDPEREKHKQYIVRLRKK